MNIILRIKNFPISFFSVVLGLLGLTIALQKAEMVFGWPQNIYQYFLYLTLTVFLIISVIYITKIIKYPKELKKEFLHPVKINFFPILAKIFLLLSIVFLEINMLGSRNLWFVGVALQLFFSLSILSVWIRHSSFKAHHLNPSWFMPIVGSVMVPIAGTAHGFVEISWFFFSVGLIMWLVLFTIVFNRLIFHDPVPDKLIPTLFITFAPPAIAFIAYIKLTSSLDPFARILYYISLFLLILIFTQAKMFLRLKFFLSWWAYSFPTAAVTIATILIYHNTGFLFFKVLSFLLLGLLSLIIIFLIPKTIKAIYNKEICIEED